MRNVSDERGTENEETFYVRQLSSENRAVNEIMWENSVVPDGAQMTIYGRRDSSVGITTRYGLESPGIESRWGEIFRTYPARPGAHPASCTMGTGSFPGLRSAGAWR
jgi:hypothetical protein